MLKDIFEKYFDKEKTKLSDNIMSSLMDGYVDVKAYRYSDDGTKKIVYHDTGDNVVTNWMRQAIMQLLTGFSFTTLGSTLTEQNKISKTQATMPNADNDKIHSETVNYDGYILNGKQFLWKDSEKNGLPIVSNVEDSNYALFPTKVLLGTGKEYSSWTDLETETRNTYPTWYTNMEAEYGGNDASINFNSLINEATNVYSGTVGIGGNTTGSGSIVETITVNDPDTSADVTSTSDMASRYGVVGAIKTLYNGDNNTILDNFTSDAGKLVQSNKRGAGRPCFIYFNKNKGEDGKIKEDWTDSTAEVHLSKDATNSEFLNRITFRITLPSQSAGSGNVGVYYPYNGYSLKQIGLFNDSFLADTSATSSSQASANMPCGMLLAIKNIEPFTKTADEEIVLTWTLTI